MHDAVGSGVLHQSKMRLNLVGDALMALGSFARCRCFVFFAWSSAVTFCSMLVKFPWSLNDPSSIKRVYRMLCGYGYSYISRNLRASTIVLGLVVSSISRCMYHDA